MGDARRRAGTRAEQQLAFYLHRAFARNSLVRIINDLRIVDPQQPEFDGTPGVCQIDHLVLHEHGAFIVESKSVGDEITVKPDGQDADQWTYRFKGRRKGVASPIKQAARQRDFLRLFLNANREALLGKMAIGLRTLSKVIGGTDQRGFSHMPIQLVVAVSDNGKIQRLNGWKEPVEPFKTFLCKADNVAGLIQREIDTHKSWISNTFKQDAERTRTYGMWSMKPNELTRVEAFLRDQSTNAATASARKPDSLSQAEPISPDLPAPQPVTSNTPPAPPKPLASCKACGQSNLTAKSGRYGYYWACNECNTNTRIPTVCEACGESSADVRIKKQGVKFIRVCHECGIDQVVWRNPAET